MLGSSRGPVSGVAEIPGCRKPEVWSAVRDAWEAEPGSTVAHVHNAITRAAHQATAKTRSLWGDDDVEGMASAALYQRAHLLAGIPDEDRAELGWS